MRQLISSGMSLLLLTACAFQRPPTYQQPPAHVPQATLTYTSNELKETTLGFADGVSSVTFYHSMDICRTNRPRELGDIQQVSKDQRESSAVIPATGNLVLETAWISKRGNCLTSFRTFSPQQGAHYRLTNHVDLVSDTCSVKLEKRDEASGNFQPVHSLVDVETYCAARAR